MSRFRHRGPDRIDNAPLREAFLASPMTASQVAYACGWVRKPPRTGAETTMVMRTLGLQTSRNVVYGKEYISCNVTVDIKNAKKICKALGVDFLELYPEKSPRPRGGRCACGERMMRSAPRCGWCEEEIALGLRAEQSDERQAA